MAAISNAVGSERISNIVGYILIKGFFQETSPNLPQRIAIFAEANTANQGTLDLNKKEITSATHAGEEYKFELKEEVPEGAKEFSDRQKRALAKVLVYIQSQDRLDGQEFHTKLHEIRKEEGIEAKDFFSALYMSFLGKESGPKAGWFLSVLDRKFLIERLQKVST